MLTNEPHKRTRINSHFHKKSEKSGFCIVVLTHVHYGETTYPVFSTSTLFSALCIRMHLKHCTHFDYRRLLFFNLHIGMYITRFVVQIHCRSNPCLYTHIVSVACTCTRTETGLFCTQAVFACSCGIRPNQYVFEYSLVFELEKQRLFRRLCEYCIFLTKHLLCTCTCVCQHETIVAMIMTHRSHWWYWGLMFYLHVSRAVY